MRFIFLILCLLPASAFAEGPQCLDLFSLIKMQRAEERPLTFRNVEIFDRDDMQSVYVGVKSRTDITFIKYIDVTEPNTQFENTLGLTAAGDLYFVMKFNANEKNQDRTIAQILNGRNRYFKDFLFSRDGFLVGVSSDKQVHIYSANKWASKEGRNVKVRAAIRGWALSSFFFTSALAYIIPGTLNTGFDVSNLHIPVALLAIPVINALTRSIPNLREQLKNFREHPDGFVETPFYYAGDLDILEQNLTTWFSNSSIFRTDFAEARPPIGRPTAPLEERQF